MIIYLLIFLLSSAAAWLIGSRQNDRLLAFFIATFLLIFVGTRFEVGCDYEAYLLRFGEMYVGLTFVDIVETVEAGFNLINLLVISLEYTFLAVLFVCGALFVICLWRFSSLSERPSTFLALSFPVLVVQLAMSGLRQALALGFLMLAYKAFAEHKRFQTLAWVLLAAQFHMSAIIFMPLALLARRTISIKQVGLALIVVGPVVGWLIGDRLGVYSDRYIEQIYGENSANGAWVRYALVLLPFIVFEWKRSLVQRYRPEIYPLLRLFSLITFSLVLAGLVSSIALHRLVYYVMPVSILAVIALSAVAVDRRSLRLASIAPYLLYGVYMFSWAASSRHAVACYVPYQSWLL